MMVTNTIMLLCAFAVLDLLIEGIWLVRPTPGIVTVGICVLMVALMVVDVWRHR